MSQGYINGPWVPEYRKPIRYSAAAAAAAFIAEEAFDESKHPRDRKGKFATKGGWEPEYEGDTGDFSFIKDIPAALVDKLSEIVGKTKHTAKDVEHAVSLGKAISSHVAKAIGEAGDFAFKIFDAIASSVINHPIIAIVAVAAVSLAISTVLPALGVIPEPVIPGTSEQILNLKQQMDQLILVSGS
jgi:hypothetical protein